MLSVLESIRLRPEFANADTAVQIAQEYDQRLHDNAHVADGYIDHAAFFFVEPDRLVVLYPWANRASANALLASEERLLENWYEKYCIGRRQVEFLEELAVEV